VSKDHYIAQTYLKRFANTEGCLYPYRKRQKKIVGKAKLPKSICYEVDGDENPYFQNPRIIDEYLPHFENYWYDKINELEIGPIDLHTKYIISGYIAFLRTCTPTAKRLGQNALSTFLQPLVDSVAQKTLDDSYNKLKPKTIKLLQKTIRCSEIIADVDRQFAHAKGIQAINTTLHTYYYSTWITLINDGDQEFITSDNPVIIAEESPTDPVFFVPVKPRLGLLIIPKIRADRLSKEFCKKYDNDKLDERAIVKPNKVKTLNKLMVQSAESTVLYHSEADWLGNLVAKYSKWCVEIVKSEMLVEDVKILISSQRRREKRD
jgi:hypothetical protein